MLFQKILISTVIILLTAACTPSENSATKELGFNYIPNFEFNQEPQHNSILVKNHQI